MTATTSAATNAAMAMGDAATMTAAATTVRMTARTRKTATSATALLDPGLEAEVLEDLLDALGVVALQLDDALLQGAAAGALRLQRGQQVVERDARVLDAVHQGHLLAVPAAVRRDADFLLLPSDVLADTDLLRETAGVADHFLDSRTRPSCISRSIVRMRAISRRSVRILPGDGVEPPIAWTP